jgi:hypothetical protein
LRTAVSARYGADVSKDDEDGGTMKRALLVVSAALSLGAFVAPPAVGDHTAQRGDVPEAACNHGTQNAHGRIPAGSPAHERVPHTHPSSTDCVHLTGHSG